MSTVPAGMDPGKPHLVVIFGAGASFDSADAAWTYDEAGLPAQAVLPPPLAGQLVSPLFDRTAAEFPVCRPIIDRLRRRIGPNKPGSLEQELAVLYEDPSSARRQQLMGFRFYLQKVISDTTDMWIRETNGFTRYVPLLDEICIWQRERGARVDLVTFNYDTLLDQAANDAVAGWDMTRDLETYVNRLDHRLFKLHGSTHWSRPLPRQQPATSWGSHGFPIAVSLAGSGIDLNQADIVGEPPGASTRETVAVPALAVPMAGKTAFECPESHLAILRASLPNVTHALIVGWRAAEPHAVRLLDGEGDPSQGLMPGYSLGIVSLGADAVEEVQGNLGNAGRKGRFELIGTSGFQGFVNDELDGLGEFLRGGLR